MSAPTAPTAPTAPPVPPPTGPEGTWGPAPAPVRGPAPDPLPEPMFTTGPLRWRSPIPRHRRRSRVGAVVGGLALLVAVVVAGGAITDTQLNTSQREREFVVAGNPGEPVSNAEVEVTVLGVRTAADIAAGQFRHDTGSVWVLVRVRVQAQERPYRIGYAAVRAPDGRIWETTWRFDQPLTGSSSHELQPGIPVEGEIAFEVPPEVATDLTLRVSRTPNVYTGIGLQQAVIEIPVPLDDATLAAGRDQTHVELVGPEVVAGGGAP